MFYVGQKVVCINDKRIRVGDGMSFKPPITEGQTYTVTALSICGCGEITIGVGLPKPRNSQGAFCLTCGYKTSFPEWAFSAKRFAPIEDWEAMHELVNELTQPELIPSL